MCVRVCVCACVHVFAMWLRVERVPTLLRQLDACYERMLILVGGCLRCAVRSSADESCRRSKRRPRW